MAAASRVSGGAEGGATALDRLEGGTSRPLELPPLPEPDRRTMRSEAKCGLTNVLLIIAIIVGLAHALPLNRRVGSLPEAAYLTCFVLIHGCAVLAVICLERVLRADPGVVRRSDKTCLPVPEPVRTRLAANAPLDDIKNIYIEDTDDETGAASGGDRGGGAADAASGAGAAKRRRTKHRGASYCVRCCVWRPQGSHHCSTCQRCVTHFDHHCSFYGRCIAGTWRSGNMPFFVALIALGYLAFFTLLVFLVWALVNGADGRHR